MANKHSRAGGKFTGNHVTLTKEAAIIADLAAKNLLCEKISPAKITAGLRNAGGKHRVKFKVVSPLCLEASVRSNHAVQIVYLYSRTADEIYVLKKALEKASRENSFAVTGLDD